MEAEEAIRSRSTEVTAVIGMTLMVVCVIVLLMTGRSQ